MSVSACTGADGGLFRAGRIFPARLTKADEGILVQKGIK